MTPSQAAAAKFRRLTDGEAIPSDTLRSDRGNILPSSRSRPGGRAHAGSDARTRSVSVAISEAIECICGSTQRSGIV
jgi:hypothetical protein